MHAKRQSIVMLGDADNGKSTFIARMLLDSGSLPLDKVSEFRQAATAFGTALALTQLCDQLSVEQETESTIGLSRFFFRLKAGTNAMIVDVPGQETKSLQAASGIYEATIGIAVIDASRPITLQTLRHLRLAFMFGVPQLIVVVNKMDLVNWDFEVYRNVCCSIESLTKKYSRTNIPIFPISSLTGEGLTSQVKHSGWEKTNLYRQLLHLIERNPTDHSPGLMVATVGSYNQTFWGRTIAPGTFPSDATLYTSRGGACRLFLKTPRAISDTPNLAIGCNLSMQLENGARLNEGDILGSQPGSTFQVDRLIVEIFSEHVNIPRLGGVSFAWQNAKFKVTSEVRDALDPQFLILHLELDAPISLDRLGFIARTYPVILYDHGVVFGVGTIYHE